MRQTIKISIILVMYISILSGCKRERKIETPTGPSLSVLTYNVNWGGGQPARTIEVIRKINADIVCLQETHQAWQRYLQQELKPFYPYMEFRETPNRAGGGLAFLTKVKGHQLAYIPSDNTFFDGWIMKYETPFGPIEILNVHLHPPVNESGSFGVSGYYQSKEKRCQEIQRFYSHFTGLNPMLVVGDFNEDDNGKALEWLTTQGFTDALAEFNHSAKTWHWKTSLLTLKSRLDHLAYSSSLHCFSCQTIPSGGSDHFPVWGVFGLNSKE